MVGRTPVACIIAELRIMGLTIIAKAILLLALSISLMNSGRFTWYIFIWMSSLTAFLPRCFIGFGKTCERSEISFGLFRVLRTVFDGLVPLRAILDPKGSAAAITSISGS